MKKITLTLLAVLLGAALLAGCSCQHEWTEASCTQPKTCIRCNLTEGEALGHSWQEADCITAKTCSRCAMTEGEPLGHSWQEADCTKARTCTLCRATEGEPLEHTWEGEATLYTAPICVVCGSAGEPLPGYLTQNGLAPNIYPGITTEYITGTLVRPDLDTTGLLTASDIRIFPSDSTHRARAGYEWRCVDVSIHFSDSRAHLYSVGVAYSRADFYQDQEMKKPAKQESFPITYNGREYWCQATCEDMGFLYDNDRFIFRMSFSVQVPVGYDGVILAFHRGSPDITGRHLHEVNDGNLLLLQMA